MTEYDTQLLDQYMADEQFFSRIVICHPNSEDYFKSRIKADDIRLLTTTYMDKNSFVVSKDCEVKILSYTSDLNGDDFANNTITIVPNFEIY